MKTIILSSLRNGEVLAEYDEVMPMNVSDFVILALQGRVVRWKVIQKIYDLDSDEPKLTVIVAFQYVIKELNI